LERLKKLNEKRASDFCIISAPKGGATTKLKKNQVTILLNEYFFLLSPKQRGKKKEIRQNSF